MSKTFMMHSGNIAIKQNSAVSVYIGIASLVLEGRVISTDEDDDDAFKAINQVDEIVPNNVSGSGGGSANRHSVIHRISEKLMRLRQFPGSSKDVIETTIAVPSQSHDDGEFEHQPRLHHVASSREFNRNQRLTSVPIALASNSSSAVSVLHDIDVDWNDISILFNGLDTLHVPASPIKLATNHNPFRINHPSMAMQQEPFKGFKNKGPERNQSVGKTKSRAKQGPHCEKFLKKIGLLKVDPSEPERGHLCNHISNYCRRWQFNLKKLLQILSKGEDSCIEVYLGPENNAILLEQWTFSITDKPSPSQTMTVQALCSAIRSQLCFSQVSSWVDLLRKAFVDGDTSVRDQMPSLFSPEIMQNPRLRKNLQTMQVDLDILFRIKAYDGASCFNDKPNVHNFPDTIVADGMALRVCLKSLPRLEKIPTLNTEKANLNGFSCDNRIKISQGVPVPLIGSPVAGAGTSGILMSDRMAFQSCHEKGKHRCMDDEEDDEYLEMSDQCTVFNPSQIAPSEPSPPLTSLSSTLSHRERQLLKYRKRMMKREKQKKKLNEGSDGTSTSVSSLNTNTSGSEDCDKASEFLDTAINDNFAPLYQTTKNGSDEQQAEAETAILAATTTNSNETIINNNNALKTLSIATQTDEADHQRPSMPKCDSCGNKMQCWNCDNNVINFNQDHQSSHLSICAPPQVSTPLKYRSGFGSAAGTMIGNKADLLLQAIQRTANAHLSSKAYDDGTNLSDSKIDGFFSCKTSRDSSPASIICDKNNNGDTDDPSVVQMENDCRLCKRQKTMHNYTTLMSVNSNNSVTSGSYRRTMSECTVNLNLTVDHDDDEIDGAMSYSPLPIHNCDDSEFDYSANVVQVETSDLSNGDLKSYRRAFSEDVINKLPGEACCFESEALNNNNNDNDDDDDEYLTMKCHCTKSSAEQQSYASLKLTPNVNLQHRPTDTNWPPSSSAIMTSVSINSKIPKINLSQVFNAIQDDSGIVHDTMDSPTSDNVFTFTNSPASSYPPTNSMQLSPRFVRSTNSLLKRRNRLVSDRSSISEYSNIELSDDEDVADKISVVPAMKAPQPSASSKISSLYKKFVNKTQAAFNKLPLLGTIEESLLRDRFTPKAIVSGFKLLLGASGSFCPTQLTIPAQTFFYEFQGLKHMSTPYVCEFRLARKGYSIPRSGTVQATLLNPQGTVVRMFFVPYDFRDMPAMSQTFIRQRVLALDESVSLKEAENMSTAEQMKHLRYVIHLRFQTGRSGRLCLHTDLKLMISRRTEFDTAAAHAKNSLESPNDLKIITITPDYPKFSSRIDKN